MTNLFLMLTGAAVLFDNHETIRFIVEVLFLLGLIALYLYSIPALIRLGLAKAKESQEVLDQFRTHLAETERLRQSKLAWADAKLSNKVAELLIKAAKYLHPPIADSRFYFDIYLISWYHEGLFLVAQARAMIAEYEKALPAQAQEPHNAT